MGGEKQRGRREVLSPCTGGDWMEGPRNSDTQ